MTEEHKRKIGEANSIALKGNKNALGTIRNDMKGDKNPARKPGIGKKISEAKKGWNGLMGHQEENSNGWKGDEAGQDAMHDWVYRQKGKPKVCEDCGATAKERRLQWANKDHSYKRKLDDYISRCIPCHRKYDLENNF